MAAGGGVRGWIGAAGLKKWGRGGRQSGLGRSICVLSPLHLMFSNPFSTSNQNRLGLFVLVQRLKLAHELLGTKQGLN